MPNLLAYLMLLVWPLVTVWLFRRMPPGRAVVWAIFAGYLLLPPLAEFKLPALPGLNKFSIPVISVWLYCLIARGERVRFIPRHPVGRLLAVGLLLAPMLAAFSNTDPIRIGPGMFLPGQGIKDAMGSVLGQLSVIMSWALARHYLRDDRAVRDLLIALVMGMLVYSFPMLIEVRMSPQVNVWVYGFFQHSFDQMMRQGGFRPIVFLEHGLWVALLTMQSVLAAIILTRSETDDALRRRWRWAAIYLAVVLVLCKTMGALVYLLTLAPLLMLAGPRTITRVAVVLALLSLLYPLLQMMHLIPMRQMVEFAASLSPDRAQSLGFRFFMEEQLLERALERFWFGWGSWGRNLVYDPLTGDSISVTDGRWIIVLGSVGLFGFLCEFGLLCLPIFALARGATSRIAAGTALMLGVNMVDLLPNATLTPMTWLLSGALLGYVEERRRTPHATAGAGAAEPSGESPPAKGPDPLPRPRTLI